MSNYICNIRCSYWKPSGYCGLTGGYETCQYRQLHSKQTNADRIRAMTDEELAKLLNGTHGDFLPTGEPLTVSGGYSRWLDWLKQEGE